VRQCIGNKISTGKDFLPKQLQGATDKVEEKKDTKVASTPNNIHNL